MFAKWTAGDALDACRYIGASQLPNSQSLMSVTSRLTPALPCRLRRRRRPRTSRQRPRKQLSKQRRRPRRRRRRKPWPLVSFGTYTGHIAQSLTLCQAEDAFKRWAKARAWKLPAESSPVGSAAIASQGPAADWKLLQVSQHYQLATPL